MKLSEYIEKYGDKQVDVSKMDELIVEDNREWFPEIGELFYVTLSFGDTIGFEYENSDDNKALLDRYRPFKTKEEAEFEDAKKVFLIFMEVEFKNNSDVIDWEDQHQDKCYLDYNHWDGTIGISFCNRVQTQGTLYTTNYNWLKQYIEDNGEDIRKYVFEL